MTGHTATTSTAFIRGPSCEASDGGVETATVWWPSAVVTGQRMPTQPGHLRGSSGPDSLWYSTGPSEVLATNALSWLPLPFK